MFKKAVKIQNSHNLAQKDKKKLKEILLSLKYDTYSAEKFLDDKNFND